MREERDEDTAAEGDFKGGPGEGREGRGGCRCSPSCRGGSGCACAADREEQDHADYTAGLWRAAFHQALHEMRVEALKAQMKSKLGKNLDETAKAAFEAMMEEWKEDHEREEAAERAKTAPKPDAALKERIKAAWKKGSPQ